MRRGKAIAVHWPALHVCSPKFTFLLLNLTHEVCNGDRYDVVVWSNSYVKASKGCLFVWKLFRLTVPECTVHCCHSWHWHHWTERNSHRSSQRWGDPGWWAADPWCPRCHGEDCCQVAYTHTNTKNHKVTDTTWPWFLHIIIYIFYVNVSSTVGKSGAAWVENSQRNNQFSINL